MLTSHPRPKAPELEVPVLPELLSPSVIPRDVSVVHTFPHCPFQVILKIKTDHMFFFFNKRGPKKSVVTKVNSFISNQSIPVLSASCPPCRQTVPISIASFYMLIMHRTTCQLTVRVSLLQTSSKVCVAEGRHTMTRYNIIQRTAEENVSRRISLYLHACFLIARLWSMSRRPALSEQRGHADESTQSVNKHRQGSEYSRECSGT